MRVLALMGLLAATLLLAGCPQSSKDMASPGVAPERGASDTSPAIEAPATTTPELPGKVDYTCQTNADCAVKDVGNCCGYYPACVNRNSPTFPKQVKAQCEAEGTMSVCGFEDIQGCACVEGRCAAAPSNALPVQ